MVGSTLLQLSGLPSCPVLVHYPLRSHPPHPHNTTDTRGPNYKLQTGSVATSAEETAEIRGQRKGLPQYARACGGLAPTTHLPTFPPSSAAEGAEPEGCLWKAPTLPSGYRQSLTSHSRCRARRARAVQPGQVSQSWS